MEKVKQNNFRKDVASNVMRPKKELIRIVKNKDGIVFVDQTKKANGRGVYIKPDLLSLEKVKKTRILERNLKTKLPEEIYLLIQKEIEENWD